LPTKKTHELFHVFFYFLFCFS